MGISKNFFVELEIFHFTPIATWCRSALQLLKYIKSIKPCKFTIFFLQMSTRYLDVRFCGIQPQLSPLLLLLPSLPVRTGKSLTWLLLPGIRRQMFGTEQAADWLQSYLENYIFHIFLQQKTDLLDILC